MLAVLGPAYFETVYDCLGSLIVFSGWFQLLKRKIICIYMNNYFIRNECTINVINTVLFEEDPFLNEVPALKVQWCFILDIYERNVLVMSAHFFKPSHSIIPLFSLTELHILPQKHIMNY